MCIVIKSCGTDKSKWGVAVILWHRKVQVQSSCFTGTFGKSIGQTYRWLLKGLRYLLMFWTNYSNKAGFYPSTFFYSCFFPKIEFFYCLHEKAFLTHFLALKHTLFITDKHLWILRFGNKVQKISSPKFVHQSW